MRRVTRFSVEILRAWLWEPAPEMRAEVVGVVIFAMRNSEVFGIDG